jgi:hypothetical protein
MRVRDKSRIREIFANFWQGVLETITSSKKRLRPGEAGRDV